MARNASYSPLPNQTGPQPVALLQWVPAVGGDAEAIAGGASEQLVADQTYLYFVDYEAEGQSPNTVYTSHFMRVRHEAE